MPLIAAIVHELKRIVMQRSFWFATAALILILGLVFYLLIENFIQFKQAELLAQHSSFGVTEEVLHPWFGWSALLALIFLPLLTMQTLSGERKHHTLVLYQLSALTTAQIIAAKFIALSLILQAVLGVFAMLPLSLISLGPVDLGQILSSFIGLELWLHALLALGILMSAWVKAPLMAALLSFGTCIFMGLLEWSGIGGFQLLSKLSLLFHLKSFLAGFISIQNLGCFLIFILSCMLMTCFRMKREPIYS